MALVTTCPHCGTSFRIVADQLKLRGGLVRCGSCLAVFSGLEKMKRLEDAAADADGARAAAGSEREASAAPDAPSAKDAPVLRDDSPGRGTQGHTGAWDDDGPLPGQIERPGRLPALPGPGDEIPPFGLPAATRVPLQDPTRGPEQNPAQDPSYSRAQDPRPSATAARLGPGGGGDDGRPQDRSAGHSRSPFALRRAERGTPEPEAPPMRERAGPGPALAPEAGQATPVLAGSPVAAQGGLARIDPPVAEQARHTRPDANAAPLSSDADDDADDEIAIGDEEMAIDYFSTEARRRGFVGQHAVLKLVTAGLLVLALVLQAVLANRDWLAARFPALEPAIAAVAAPFGLPIAPPRTLDALSIESFELQADASSELLAVSAIIHNGARHAVRWPSIMLTLTDTQNRVLVRKAIDPADYLNGAADVALRPNSERPIRLALEARKLRPAGYSAVLFYR